MVRCLSRVREIRGSGGKMSVSGAGDPRIAPRFSWSSHTNDLINGSSDGCPARCLALSRTGWPGVSIL